MAATIQTKNAQLVWNRLNGIVCIYKPPMISWRRVRETLLKKLSGELNEMECRPQRPHVNIVGDTSRQLVVDVAPSYADHPLAIGPRYMPTEIKALFVKPLSSLTSGVCVLGINRGNRTATYIRKSIQVSTFRITGQLGLLTDDKTSSGKIILRCRSNHIQRLHIDKTVSKIEAMQKKSLFALTGVHPQSQAAYEMLSQGSFRPTCNDYPLVYSIKCIELNVPYFTIEVVSANENEQYLLDLVCEIGSSLRNVAVTTSIQCTRCGYFSLEDALLKKHWTLQNVIDNMARCNKILRNNKQFSEYLQQIENEEMAGVDAHESDLFEEYKEYEEEEKQMTKEM